MHGISNSVKDEEICKVFSKCKISSFKFDLRLWVQISHLREDDKKIMEYRVFYDSQIKKSKFQKNEKNPIHEPIVNKRKSLITQVNCEFDLNHFDLEWMTNISKWSFANVYKVTHKKTNDFHAFKIFHSKLETITEKRNFKCEIEYQETQNNLHVINIYVYSSDYWDRRSVIIIELAENVSLSKNEFRKIDRTTRRRWKLTLE